MVLIIIVFELLSNFVIKITIIKIIIYIRLIILDLTLIKKVYMKV